MSTACFELARSIPERLSELDLLIVSAREVESQNEPLYNATCRACCVLMASHLEGYIKDLTRSILQDLNFHLGKFSLMPKAMQQEFCWRIAYFEGVPTDQTQRRVNQLKSFFETNSVQIDLLAFQYKESLNRNPSTDQVQASLAKLGVPHILHIISTPAFEVVFDNLESTNWYIVREMRRLTSSLYKFPYKNIDARYLADKKALAGKPKKQQTLWHAYIEEIMKRRHSVAHGDSLVNDTTWEELDRDVSKLRVLMYGILFATCGYLGTSLLSLDDK